MSIQFSIEQGDITSFDADVVALKYAHAFYGADWAVASALSQEGQNIEAIQPSEGDHSLVNTMGAIAASRALFVGVPYLRAFDYGSVRTLAVSTLSILAREAANIKHLAMTIHGVGYGLDEIETIRAQFAGFLEALTSGDFPPSLEYISIIEFNKRRVDRLRQALDIDLAYVDYALPLTNRWGYELLIPQAGEAVRKAEAGVGDIERAGEESESKPHAFVAMPFRTDMDDVFFYGIQGPVREAGFLCERMDRTAFTGDIVEQIKKRIESATVLIAELTGANPNVFLELGYAWGLDKPTVLVVKEGEELPFDVRTQRCLMYERIKDLETALASELSDLKSGGRL